MALRLQVSLTAEQARWLIHAGKWILSDPFCRQEMNEGQQDALRAAVRALESAAPPPANQR